jgi:hypothetical protein
MLMLRFRDLTIPDGETIRRHEALIATRRTVWWGWIMRQDETFPNDYVVKLSRELAEQGTQRIVPYHSGAGQFFYADLARISALPGGYRIRSPEMELTPVYMHESVCPAWFELKQISLSESMPAFVVKALPTLPNPSPVDKELAGGVEATAALLRNSGATLWDIELSK